MTLSFKGRGEGRAKASRQPSTPTPSCGPPVTPVYPVPPSLGLKKKVGLLLGEGGSHCANRFSAGLTGGWEALLVLLRPVAGPRGMMGWLGC